MRFHRMLQEPCRRSEMLPGVWWRKSKVNEFNERVREVFSVGGDIVIKSMMGGYLVYLNGKLIGDICDNELFLKRTPTSDRLLAESELRYPYEGSKTLMHVQRRGKCQIQ